MSDKAKTSTLGKKGSPQFNPKLRFPRFQDAEGWRAEPLALLYSFKSTNTYSRDKLNYESGKVKNIHYGDIHTKFSTMFHITRESVPYINPTESLARVKPDSYCIEGDMIFADASEDLQGVGKSIEIVDLNHELVLSGLHTLLARQRTRHLIIGFGGHLFKSDVIRAKIKNESQGGKVLGISVGRLSNIQVCFPVTKGEQLKITDCLTAADELITAETRRLDALTTHKKGLMQQLFPRDGEARPRLRFPQFQDAGEWGEEKLDDLFHLQDGFAFKSTDFVKNKEDATQVIRITDINKKNTNEDKVYIPNAFLNTNNLNKYFVEDGDLLLSLTGAAGFNFFFWNGSRSVINQRTSKVTPKKKLSSAMSRLLEPLIHERINVRGEGQNNNLSKDFLSSVVLFIPESDEQRKIATCLMSLDELIATRIQYLDALKTHKGGLMQQLFPPPEAVES